MIRQGADAAIVRARLAARRPRAARRGADQPVGARTGRRSTGRPIKPRELPRYFSSVLFAPEDLALVRGEPGIRRRFFDQLLVQRNPRLAGVLADYERVLQAAQHPAEVGAGIRVCARASSRTLDIWDERLVALGSEIMDARVDLVAATADPLVARLPLGRRRRSPPEADPAADDPRRRRSTSERRRMQRPDAEAEPARRGARHADAFRAALGAVRRKELDRGITLVGPHRDDILFELNGLPAKGYASHGESWSFALALKLASAELLRRESTTGDPVLILDDVFAELDQARRRMLAAAVHGYEQVLITAAVFDDVPAELTAHTVRIEAGAVVDGRDDADARGDRAGRRRARHRRSTCASASCSAECRQRDTPAREEARRTTIRARASPFGIGPRPAGLGDVVTRSPTRARLELAARPVRPARGLGRARRRGDRASTRSPIGITEGVLTVQCDSTAWATQLRLMRVRDHDAHRPAVPRRGHPVDPLSGARRPLLEKRPQINSRAWSARYLRLSHKRGHRAK